MVSSFSQLLMTGYKNTDNHYTMLQGGKILKNYQGVYRVVITLKSMTHKMCRGHIWGVRIAQWWSTGHVIKRLQVWVLAVSRRIFFSRDCSTFCADSYFQYPFHPHVSMLLQLHDKLKDQSHSAKSTHGRLYLNTQMYTFTEFVKCLGPGAPRLSTYYFII